MTDANQADGHEALLTLIDRAQREISDALVDFSPDKAGDARQLCVNYLDHIVIAATRAGLDNLYLVTEALLALYGDEEQPFSAERGSEFLGWLADAYLYLESPDSPEFLNLLLSPLPADQQAALGAILGEAEAVDEWQPEVPPEPAAANATAADAFADAFAEAADIDSDSILGILAIELRDVAPEFSAQAQALVQAEDDEGVSAAVDGYRQILQRIASVAQELQLDGLGMICDFIGENLALASALTPAERARSLGVLQHWPQPVIEHLIHPEDDALCIAVIDFLELDGWPQPLPYRDLRALIDGLAAAVDVGSEETGEQREIEATPEDISLGMSADASPELIEAFFDESPGHAESLAQLVAAIGNGDSIQENVEAAQRIAHTLKGSGNLVGVRGIANLAHHIEDIFEYIARNRITPPAALAGTMQEAADTIEAMIESLQGMASPPGDAQRVLQDVLDWANRIDSGKMRSDDYREAEPAASMSESAPVEETPVPEFEERRSQNDADAPAAAPSSESVRVPLKLLDDIFRIVSETAITSGQIQERLNHLEASEKLIRNNDGSMQQLRYELENLVSIRGMASRHRGSGAGSEDADFDPLEMDEYDEFYGATHAYIESVADSREILRGFSSEVLELDSLFVEQQRLNKELQQMVMATRMVPVGNIAARLQRTVRQVCRSTGKLAELSIIGQDLMLDGDVLNKLADPLMHMLRNAVDHGIESSELREAAEKSPQGQVTLRFQQEGNNVVVRCSDDGGGLDYERIRQIAIERGLLSADAHIDNVSLAGLILQSGFSTRDKITHVSGRGVGMDVVHNTIQSLNGSMDIGEAAEGGTQVTLRLPITLLTSHCLLVGVGRDHRYAIPTLSLSQILSPGVGEVGREADKLIYRLEQEVYPAYTLNSLIGAPESSQDGNFADSGVLLVQTADGVSAVYVEQVITSYDLVVKNMGAYVKSVSGIAGVSMLGNGEVVPVLDLGAMLQAQGTRVPAIANTAAVDSVETELPRVMIVDDSLSVRNSLSQLMQDSGYQVMLARDGREAVIMLEKERPDVVLTDLEMPRMNGLELVSYIRNSSKWRDLPAVMITSRNMAKHRQQAQQVGVNRFIAKPFTEDEVLDAIDEQLAATVEPA